MNILQIVNIVPDNPGNLILGIWEVEKVEGYFTKILGGRNMLPVTG